MEISYIIIPTEKYEDTTSRVSEITALVESAGAIVKGVSCIKINKIAPATYIGKGKIEEIKIACENLECNLVVFDGDLTPSQTINLSETLGDVKVIDRTTLILDIFASRARTAEGKIQVELAQLKYIYPRLKGKGSALSRLGGGIGTRGPGESKLETDRRHIRRKINYLEERLKELENRRHLQIDRRNKNGVFKIALVGYTNTGKSTLLNTLTQSAVLTENKLFATLDPTTRKLSLGEFSVLITDTVGFIKNIPTTLIEAFKSTLENAVDADIILIVCDALTDWMIQLETTNQMLDELKCSGKRLIVFNKCENITDFSHYPHEAVFISAKEKKGLDGLIIRLRSFLEDNYSKLSLKIPYNLLSEFYSLQNYLESVQVEYLNEFVLANIVVNKTSLSKFNKFKQK